METVSKWIKFVETGDTGKTKIWSVVSVGHELIGHIKWYGPWRQYCLFSNGISIWNRECLEDVERFIHEQMLSRKK